MALSAPRDSERLQQTVVVVSARLSQGTFVRHARS
jgi:hypothetical protein